MLPALSYWTIVLEPPATVESASVAGIRTKYEPFSIVIESERCWPVGADPNVASPFPDAMFDSSRLSCRPGDTRWMTSV